MRDREGAKVSRPGREPHWLGSKRLFVGARTESLTVMTCSTILDTVFRRTRTLKKEEESYEAFPGLSKTPPLAFVKVG